MRASAATTVLALVLAGCVEIPQHAFELPPSSLEVRQLQSRAFATDQKTLLVAGIAVLQDLGYALDATNSHLGVLTASKEISARRTSQFVGSLLLAALTGAPMPVDDKQKIRVCLVVSPRRDDKASVARITIQRVIWTDQGVIGRVEAVTEPAVYQTFFDKLAKATFLEANPT